MVTKLVMRLITILLDIIKNKMKKLVLLLFLLLVLIKTTTAQKITKTQTIVSVSGDTLIEIPLADAKVILSTILQKEISDTIISKYIKQDTIQTNTILLLKKEVDLYKIKVSNLEYINTASFNIISNKDQEIAIGNETIKKQKKEIIKQKTLKITGFTTTIVLPILLYLLIK